MNSYHLISPFRHRQSNGTVLEEVNINDNDIDDMIDIDIQTRAQLNPQVTRHQKVHMAMYVLPDCRAGYTTRPECDIRENFDMN